MDSTTLDDAAVTRMETFLEGIGGTLKDKRQRASFALYAAGLMSDGERKSMEPIAARTSGDRADAPVRTFSARYAVNAMQAHAPIRTWVHDVDPFPSAATITGAITFTGDRRDDTALLPSSFAERQPARTGTWLQ